MPNDSPRLASPSTKRCIQQTDGRRTFYSFGDDGVTATVSPLGLLQFSRYFAESKYQTGFCVDSGSMDEPYWVQSRIEELHSRATYAYKDGSIEPFWNLSVRDEFLPIPEFVHDRWPRFILESNEGISAERQYLIHGGIVFLAAKFTWKDETPFEKILKVEFEADCLIRELDFVKHPHQFNRHEDSDTSYYRTDLSPDSAFMIRRHRLESTGREAIGLFTSVYSDNQLFKFKKNDVNHYELDLNDECVASLKEKKAFSLIVAFKLDMIPWEEVPSTMPVSLQQFQHIMNELQRAEEPKYEFSTDLDVDFCLRRNLEYNLSVCSIPVTHSRPNEVRAIALTCGDIDGHRVATAASFYCFQFLLQALNHLNRLHSESCKCETWSEAPSDLSYLCRSRLRILKTCLGHLRWLFEIAEKSEGFFAPHYWINGGEIKDWKTNEYLPGKSLIDTPFHIIKFTDFSEQFEKLGTSTDFYEQYKKLRPSTDNIRKIVDCWVNDLHKTNKKGMYAFPRCRDEPFQNFYLTDHALIWRAIKGLENLGLKSRLQVPPADEEKSEAKQKRENSKNKPKIYSSTLIQQNIIRRFTVENPITKQRMLALSRSPAHSRFLLRAKDTSLFRAMSLGLFDKPNTQETGDQLDNKIDIWKRTIDIQMRLDDNDDSSWQHPLRFVLAIIMARHEKRTNQLTVNEMLSVATTTLLQSSSPNGLFPGALDDVQEPTLYDDELNRDTYWSVVFEVPLLLWMYHPRFADKPPATDNSERVVKGKHEPRKDQTSLQPQTTELMALLEQILGARGSSDIRGSTNPLGTMKHTLPFNNAVFQENIVELYDEWLYNEPQFFFVSTDDVSINDASHNDASTLATSLTSEGNQTSDNAENGTLSSWVHYMRKLLIRNRPASIDKTINISGEAEPATSGGLPSFRRNEEIQPLKIDVIDIPKSNPSDNSSPLDGDTGLRGDPEGVITFMQRGRTPESAKKRLWWFRSEEPSLNETCAYTWPKKFSESPSQPDLTPDRVSSLHGRHQSYEKLFYDDTVPVLNTWTTELHLSFYTLEATDIVKRKIRNGGGQDEMRSVPFPATGRKNMSLARAMMSFQFEGDFFDRYWTCRFLESGLRLEHVNVQSLMTGETSRIELDGKKPAWKQRRVLELRLFDRILRQMQRGSLEILKEAVEITQGRNNNTETDLMQDATQKVDYRNFSNTSRTYQQVQKVLSILHSDLTENLATIDLWQNREKERQTERPRWSFNDESRYRSKVSKQTTSNNHLIENLKRTHSKISSHIESLSKSLDSMRTDLDQRRADDIQRFTYVTVVFLPLGFATGMYSMSGAPAKLTLSYMVATAVAALLITLILLFKAERLESLWQQQGDLMPTPPQDTTGYSCMKWRRSGDAVLKGKWRRRWKSLTNKFGPKEDVESGNEENVRSGDIQQDPTRNV